MVIEAMLKRPQMFNAWLSIDPSLWYDNRKLLRESAGLLEDNRLTGEMFFLAIANNLKPGMDTLRMKKDTSRATNDTRAIFDFVQSLRLNPRSGLQWTYQYYGDDDHGSVTQIAEYDGLRYFFRDYRLPAWEYLLDSTVQPDLLLKKQFDRLSASWGFDVHPPEAFVNALAYTLMQQKRMESSMRLFQLNIDAYPGSANAYDSMGDCLLASGDKTRAREMYLKSLSLMEGPLVRKKLADLDQQ
jgi:tetratricopeptide (TPR) repeat protein